MAGVSTAHLEPGTQGGECSEDRIVAIAPEEGAVAVAGQAVTAGLQEVQPPQRQQQDEGRTRRTTSVSAAPPSKAASTPFEAASRLSPSRMITNRP